MCVNQQTSDEVCCESCYCHRDTGSNVTQLSILLCVDTGTAVKTHPNTPEIQERTL